jgi:hypothetical protein
LLLHQKQTGKTPVAKGSKLPVCPALAALNKRLACCSARFDVIPVGLLSRRTPSINRPFLCRMIFYSIVFLFSLHLLADVGDLAQ